MMRRVIATNIPNNDDESNQEEWDFIEKNEKNESALEWDSDTDMLLKKPVQRAWYGDFKTVNPSEVEDDDNEHVKASMLFVNQVKKSKTKSNSINRKNSKKKSRQSETTTESIRTLAFRPMFLFRSYIRAACLSIMYKDSISIEVLLVLVGFLQSIITELTGQSKSINAVIILVLGASIKFKSFPESFVRPQVSIALLVAVSIGVDIFNCIVYNLSSSYVAGIIFITHFKLILLISLLYNTTISSRRARKYLIRRLRLFGISTRQPRRIMRDIRARLMAFGWLQLSASLFYFTCSVLAVAVYDYSIFYLSQNLPFFLLIKGIFSGLLFLLILYDTDIILSLWYFGCLAFNWKYIRRYISYKRIQLGGWPLAYSFHRLRFRLLKWLKLLDVLIGIYGWMILAPIFSPDFFSRETKLRIYLTFVAFGLFVTDVWCPILLYMIQLLIRKRRILKSLELLEVSDDSEIDEFELRSDLVHERMVLAASQQTITVGIDRNSHNNKDSQLRAPLSVEKIKPTSSKRDKYIIV